MASDLGVVLYYAWLALGSVSLGYLVLRVTVPDVRTRPPDEKLGVSAVLGILAMVTAMFLDGALFGWTRFSLAQGFTAALAVFTVSLSFVLLKLYVILFPPQFLEVGVPLAPPSLVVSEPGARASPPARKPVTVPKPAPAAPARAEEIREPSVEKI